jgi:two-component system response regulator YesN
VLDTLSRISRAPGNIDSVVYSVKQYIDQNYNLNLSLDSLAARVHLSPSYLSKLFKKEMGENLSTYILNTRIEHAKLLFRTTDYKAYEIAEAIGIYDPVYFSKIFKKATGMKPREFRDSPESLQQKG